MAPSASSAPPPVPTSSRSSRSSARPGRRRARLSSLLLAVLTVAAGAWFALRRRSPAAPTFVAEAGPGPGTTQRPVPATPAPSPPAPAPASPNGAPSEPAASGPVVAAVDGASDDHAARSAGAAADELQRVQGIGRRSAEALVAGGIDSLQALAGADDEQVLAALAASGLRRSPTLSSWASQARRLTTAREDAPSYRA